MKKTLAIIAILFCVLFTSSVYATGTAQEAFDSFSGSTQKAIDNLTGSSNSKNGNKNNDVNNTNETNETNNKKENNNAESSNRVEQKKETNSATSKLVDIKDREKKTLEDYQEAYGSDSYGLTAYILGRIQIYSIPFCFLGIAISAIYQYVLGVRKLDTRDKGFAIMISIITIFVIAQVLPLIFAIVVKGWRG